MEHYLTTQFVQLPRMQTATPNKTKPPPLTTEKNEAKSYKTESEKCELRVWGPRADGWWLGS